MEAGVPLRNIAYKSHVGRQKIGEHICITLSSTSFADPKQIVDKESGVLNYPQEIVAPMDADHHTIAKFSSPIDPNYVLVANLLKQITRDVPQSSGKRIMTN